MCISTKEHKLFTFIKLICLRYVIFVKVIEACWSLLVNACEWEGMGTTTGPGELAAALCAACFELQRGKGSRKFPRTLWDHGMENYHIAILHAL